MEISTLITHDGRLIKWFMSFFFLVNILSNCRLLFSGTTGRFPVHSSQRCILQSLQKQCNAILPGGRQDQGFPAQVNISAGLTQRPGHNVTVDLSCQREPHSIQIKLILLISIGHMDICSAAIAMIQHDVLFVNHKEHLKLNNTLDPKTVQLLRICVILTINLLHHQN